MEYTTHGLKITLDELEGLLEHARNRAKYGNMEHCIYIKGGEKPQITQYCKYADGTIINHTYLARQSSK